MLLMGKEHKHFSCFQLIYFNIVCIIILAPFADVKKIILNDAINFCYCWLKVAQKHKSPLREKSCC